MAKTMSKRDAEEMLAKIVGSPANIDIPSDADPMVATAAAALNVAVAKLEMLIHIVAILHDIDIWELRKKVTPGAEERLDFALPFQRLGR